MKKTSLILLILIASIQIAYGQVAKTDDQLILLGKSYYINPMLWKEVEPLAYSRGKLVPVSKINNDTILQTNYLDPTTKFKFIDLIEYNYLTYYKVETEKRYYYLRRFDKPKYVIYVEEIDDNLLDFDNDDKLLGHDVYLDPSLWENVTPYSISSGRLKPVSEIDDEVMNQEYRNNKTWFKFMVISDINGEKYYKLQTDKRYYYLKRYPKLDVYCRYAEEKNIAQKLIGKTYECKVEFPGATGTKKLTFVDDSTAEYSSKEQCRAAEYKWELTNGKIKVYKKGENTFIYEIHGKYLLEPDKKLKYILKK